MKLSFTTYNAHKGIQKEADEENFKMPWGWPGELHS